MNPEVQVRTLEPKAEDYTAEGEKRRRWGVGGVIIAHHDSHGLCYDVKHDDDGSVGTYDPDELTFTKGRDWPKKRYPGRIAGCTC